MERDYGSFGKDYGRRDVMESTRPELDIAYNDGWNAFISNGYIRDSRLNVYLDYQPSDLPDSWESSGLPEAWEAGHQDAFNRYMEHKLI